MRTSRRRFWRWLPPALIVVALLGAGGVIAGLLLSRPHSSSLRFSGAIAGQAVFSPIEVRCGELDEPPSRRVAATVSVQGHQLSVVLDHFQTYGLFVQAGGDLLSDSWRGGANVSSFDPESQATFDATLPSEQLNVASLHVEGTIACPPPGSPSSLTFSGALGGSMSITNVNCRLPVGDMFTERPHTDGHRIDVIGQVSGTDVEVAIEGAGNANRSSVVVTTPLDEKPAFFWVSQENGGVSSFNWERGATIDSTNAFKGPASQFTGKSLRVSGQVTCPG